MKDNQKVLLSFIVGAAAGVAAGMLLAPYSGQDSRRRIADKASTLTNDLSGQLGGSIDKLNELKNSVVASINELAGKALDKGTKVAEFGAEKVREAADKGADFGNRAKV